MKTFFYSVLFILAFFGNFYDLKAQNTSINPPVDISTFMSTYTGDFIAVQHLESFDGLISSFILIADSKKILWKTDLRSSEMKLKKMKEQESINNLVEVLEVIHKKGFKLLSINSTNTSQVFPYTTYIFYK